MWQTEQAPVGIVIWPIDDIVRHSHNERCVCAPVVERVYGTCLCQGYPLLSMKKIITHQAMDGRV